MGEFNLALIQLSSSVEECLNLLESVNLNDLDDDTLKAVKDKLKSGCEVHTEQNTAPDNKIKNGSVILGISSAVMLGALFFNPVISLISAGVVLGDAFFLVKSVGAKQKKIADLECAEIEANNKISNIDYILDCREKAMRKEAEEVIPVMTTVNKDVLTNKDMILLNAINKIGESELFSQVNDLNKKVVSLPENLWQDYNARITNILNQYARVNSMLKDVYVSSGLEGVMDYKNTRMKEIQKLVNQLDADLYCDMFVNSSDSVPKKIKDLVKQYIEDIPGAESKTVNFSKFSKLMRLLSYNPGSLEIQDLILGSFARCFWVTVKYASSEERSQLIAGLFPDFQDDVIYFGEQILSILAETPDVKNIKMNLAAKRNVLDFREYIEELIFGLEKLNCFNDKGIVVRKRKASMVVKD